MALAYVKKDGNGNIIAYAKGCPTTGDEGNETPVADWEECDDQAAIAAYFAAGGRDAANAE